MPNAKSTTIRPTMLSGALRMPLPHGGLQVSDDVMGVVTLARSGLGICQAYDFIAQDLIAQGRTAQVLSQARGR